MKVREMTHADAQAVHDLDRKCGLGFWSLQSYKGEVTNPVSRYLVAEYDDGRIIGFIGLWFVVEEAQVMNVAVDPGFRRMRLGTLLMKTAEKLAATEGLKEMTLEVKAENVAALALYKKLGFEIVGTRKNYYPDGSDGVLMKKVDLE